MRPSGSAVSRQGAWPFLPDTLQDCQNCVRVAAGPTSRRPDYDAFRQWFGDLNCLLVFNPETVQRLRFGKSFPAPYTAEALNDPVFVLKMAETLGFAIAAGTRHFWLDFLRPKIYGAAVSERICSPSGLWPTGRPPWVL